MATTTIHVGYSSAELIRVKAKKDLPDIGVRQGEVFYLARSSKNDGSYYVITWQEDRIAWSCRCPATKPCRHEKAVNAALALCRARIAKAMGPEAEAAVARMQAEDDRKWQETAQLNGSRAFSLMR